jgi:hypothetical protein
MSVLGLNTGGGPGVVGQILQSQNIQPAVVALVSDGTGPGLRATAITGAGVEASTQHGIGVDATSASGVAIRAHIDTTTSVSPVVSAQSNGKGAALVATTTATATNPALKATSGAVKQAAVQANGASNGLALDVHGAVKFSRSGVLHIAGTNNGFTAVVPGGLTSNSHVLATLQSDVGTLSVRAAVPMLSGSNTGKVKILLTGTAPASGVNVAWFVLG